MGAAAVPAWSVAELQIRDGASDTPAPLPS